MLQYFDGRAGRIVRLGHSHCSRVPCDMHNSAVRKPLQQFGDMPDVDRKLNTSPFATAESRNFFNQNPGDRAQARSDPLTRREISRFSSDLSPDILKSPEGASSPARFFLAKHSSTILSTSWSNDRSPTPVLKKKRKSCVLHT